MTYHTMLYLHAYSSVGSSRIYKDLQHYNTRSLQNRDTPQSNIGYRLNSGSIPQNTFYPNDMNSPFNNGGIPHTSRKNNNNQNIPKKKNS